MKALKVPENIHQAVKIEAAKTGRTTFTVAELLLRHSLELLESGKIDLAKLEKKQNPA